MRKVLFLGMGSGYTYDCNVNFYEPLTKIVATVNYDFFTRVRQVGPQMMNREVLSLVEQERPDCVFVHTFRHEIFKVTLREITDRGIATVLWFSDDHWRFDDYSRHFADVISCSVTTDHLSVPRYQAANIPVILSQWASNPDYYRPLDVEKDIDVSFVGARMPAREELFAGLHARGVRVEAFGNGWPSGHVSFDEMVRIFSRSRINLNSSYFWKGRAHPQIKGRVFEIPMSGGFLLTDYAFRLEDYFDLNREVVCYRSVDEAAALIKHYLAHEDERARVAAAGYRRSLRDHTWEVRLRALFTEVEQRRGLPHRVSVAVARDAGSAAARTGLPVGPPVGCVMEVFVGREQDVTFRTSTRARAFVSTDDLRDGLVHVIESETNGEIEVSHLHADGLRAPGPRGRCDVAFAASCFDWLNRSRAAGLAAECSRVLARGGLLVGAAKLWYATDLSSRAIHRHRGYLEAHSPASIRQLLREVFASVAVVEVHRPMGPLGPFIVFLASKDKNRLGHADVRGLLRALKATEGLFTETRFDSRLTWSALLHGRDWRASLSQALKALEQRPLHLGAWKAVARAVLGRRLWGRLRWIPWGRSDAAKP